MDPGNTSTFRRRRVDAPAPPSPRKNPGVPIVRWIAIAVFGIAALFVAIRTLDLLMVGSFYSWFFERIRNASGLPDELSGALSTLCTAVALLLIPTVCSLIFWKRSAVKTLGVALAVACGFVILYFLSLPPEGEFFNPMTGQPRYKYARSPNGNIELFFVGYRYHPRYGTPLQVVTEQVIREYERQHPPYLTENDVRGGYGQAAAVAAYRPWNIFRKRSRTATGHLAHITGALILAAGAIWGSYALGKTLRSSYNGMFTEVPLKKAACGIEAMAGGQEFTMTPEKVETCQTLGLTRILVAYRNPTKSRLNLYNYYPKDTYLTDQRGRVYKLSSDGISYTYWSCQGGDNCTCNTHGVLPDETLRTWHTFKGALDSSVRQLRLHRERFSPATMEVG